MTPETPVSTNAFRGGIAVALAIGLLTALPAVRMLAGFSRPAVLDVLAGHFQAPVDLNRASVEELVALPGIGPVRAREIVAYRQRHGRFRTLEDLHAVKGLGEHTIEQLTPLAVVTP